MEKLRPQRSFECLELLAQRGLRKIQPSRCDSEAALLGHGDEISDLTEIHSKILLIVSFYILDTWSGMVNEWWEVLPRSLGRGRRAVSRGSRRADGVSAAGQQRGGAGNRFRSVNGAVKNNSGIGREPTKPH
jgi:hypothetical protein